MNAYAEIIATRPLGIVVYCCIPMDDAWRWFEDYSVQHKRTMIDTHDFQTTSSLTCEQSTENNL